MDRTRSRYLAAVALLVLVAFSTRASSLDAQSLWRDEVDALRFATAPRSELLGNFTEPGWNGPLYFLLLRGWIALTGTSEYAMRFFSLVPGVLSIPLIYVLGRRLFNPATGLISALLVTTSPYLVWYSQEVKMYTLVLALSLMAIYSLRRGLGGDGWIWWMAQIAATTLAFYSHILAALLIPVQILLCIVWWPQTRQRWQKAVISFAVLTLPYLPLVVWQAPLALKARETGFSSYSLNQMIVILLNGWATGITGWADTWGAALMSLLAAGGFISQTIQLSRPADSGGGTTTKGSSRNSLALVIWLVLPLLSVWLISQRQPLFTDRYLIWCSPAFYLLIAVALTPSESSETLRRWWVALPLAIVLTINGVNIWRQATMPIKSDFRAAAAYVADYEEPSEPVALPPPATDQEFETYLPMVTAGDSGTGDLIIFQMPYGRYTFDYYFPREEYPRAEGLYTNHRTPDGAYQMSEQQAAWRMRETTEGHEAIWLVASEVATWDERNLVQAWLDEHYEREAEAHFARVDVYRYTAPDA
jgi:4-amino-4-deoxy-L-arabinose transferase-like glycosyltransferase